MVSVDVKHRVYLLSVLDAVAVAVPHSPELSWSYGGGRPVNYAIVHVTNTFRSGRDCECERVFSLLFCSLCFFKSCFFSFLLPRRIGGTTPFSEDLSPVFWKVDVVMLGA